MKRERRANGDLDARGKAKRRKNNTGTIEKRGDRWLARYFVYIDGRRVRKAKTLDARTVAEARDELARLSDGGAAFTRERELEKTERELRGIRARIEDEQRRKAEDEQRRKADEAESRAIRIADGWAHYVASKKRPDSGARTLDGYRAQYAIFAEWCARNYPDRPKLRDFTAEMAERFLDGLERTRSRNTRNKYLILLRGVWRVVRQHPDALITADPWDGIRTLVQAPDEIRHRTLTTDELARIGETILSREPNGATRGVEPTEDGRGRRTVDLRGELATLFAVGLYTGLRLADCALLDWGCVDVARGIITATPRKTARRYARNIIIPIHPALTRILGRVPSDERRGFVLPHLGPEFERYPSLVSRRVQRIFTDAGLETAVKGESGTKARTVLGFHSLRHHFAAWLDNHGTNHQLTNYLTCHQQGTVEARYFHENEHALRVAVETLPTVESLAASSCTDESAPVVIDADGVTPITIANANECNAIQTGADGTTFDPLPDTCEDSGNTRESRLDAFLRAWDALTDDEKVLARARIGE